MLSRRARRGAFIASLLHRHLRLGLSSLNSFSEFEYVFLLMDFDVFILKSQWMIWAFLRSQITRSRSICRARKRRCRIALYAIFNTLLGFWWPKMQEIEISYFENSFEKMWEDQLLRVVSWEK